MKQEYAALLLIVLLLVTSLKAEENEEKSITGTIVHLDWVGSVVTVRYYPTSGSNATQLYYPSNADADEINLIITDNSIIYRGTQTISFGDILLSDPVTVTYYDDGFSGLKIKRLTDLNTAST
jgi:hypothetical protein